MQKIYMSHTKVNAILEILDIDIRDETHIKKSGMIGSVLTFYIQKKI